MAGSSSESRTLGGAVYIMLPPDAQPSLDQATAPPAWQHPASVVYPGPELSPVQALIVILGSPPALQSLGTALSPAFSTALGLSP